MTRACGVGSLALAGWVATVAGCSLASAVDVCDRGPDPEGELNIRTEGDQILQGTRAVTGTPDGRAFVAFTSVSSTDPERAEVRGTRLADDARPIPTCDEARERTLAAIDPAGPAIFNGGASVAATDDETRPLIVAWAEDGVEGDRVLLTALDASSGCGYFDGGSLSGIDPYELAARPGGTLSPPRALWLRDDRFAFFWLDVDDTGVSADTRGRVFRINEGGILPQLVVDAQTGERTSDRPVALTAAGVRTFGFDAIAAEDRVVIARYVGVGGRLQVEVSIHREDLSVEEGPFAVSELFWGGINYRAALAWDGEQLLVAWAQAAEEGSPPRVWARLLTLQGDFLSSPLAPDGGAFRVSTSEPIAERAPAAVALPGGGFLVGWTSGSGEMATFDIRGAMFDRAGERQFANRACDRADFPLSQVPEGDQGNVSFARLGDRVIAAWTDAGGNGADTSGFAVRVAVLEPHTLLPVR